MDMTTTYTAHDSKTGCQLRLATAQEAAEYRRLNALRPIAGTGSMIRIGNVSIDSHVEMVPESAENKAAMWAWD